MENSNVRLSLATAGISTGIINTKYGHISERVCSFQLSCRESWKDQNGDYKHGPNKYINVKLWRTQKEDSVVNKLIDELVAGTLGDGALVRICGELVPEKSEWTDQDGNKKSKIVEYIVPRAGLWVNKGAYGDDNAIGIYIPAVEIMKRSTGDNTNGVSAPQKANKAMERDEDLPFYYLILLIDLGLGICNGYLAFLNLRLWKK